MKNLNLSNLLVAASLLLGAASASAKCNWDQWESVNGRCYDKKGSCSQYNYTNKWTCNNGKDDLQCDWNSRTNVCYTEGGYDGGGINPGTGPIPAPR